MNVVLEWQTLKIQPEYYGVHIGTKKKSFNSH